MDIQIKNSHDLQTCNNVLQLNFVNTDQQILSILSTVLERCKKEKDNNCLQVPLEDYLERVSYYTAYPKMYIYHLIEENPLEKEEFDLYDHILLMECINVMYSKKSLPILKNLYKEFMTFKSTYNSEKYKIKGYYNLKKFEIKLYLWGYVSKKLSEGSFIIMENPKIKFARFNYLHKIMNYRQKGRQIYYVDERHILKDSIRRYSTTFLNNKPQVFSGFLYFHIISCNGYENGIFIHEQIDKSFEELFKKWMIDIVLPSIKPSSVIVMEKSAMLGLLPKKPITRYHTKKQMLEWLRQNNVPCDNTMPKPILYDLIEKCTSNNEDYDIDRIFKSYGHDVLRLPTTFASLTPTTFLWNYIGKNIRIPKISESENVKYIISLTIKNIEKCVWATFANKTESIEKDIYEIDTLAEKFLEEYELDSKVLFD